MKPDAIKTIREALDLHLSVETREQARAALDSLEAELAALQRRVEMNELDERIQELHEERHDLESRARLGAKPTKRLAEVHAELDRLEMREDELRKGITERMMARLAPADSTPRDEELRKAIAELESEAPSDWAISVVCRAAEAHLRSQQPETEEQRAERELVAWLQVHPNRFLYRNCNTFTLFADGRAFEDWVPESDGKTLVEAVDALAKARDAEGGE